MWNRRYLKRILVGLLVGVGVLVSVLIVNTIRFNSKQVSVSTVAVFHPDENAISQRLAESLRFQTVSEPSEKQSRAADFTALGHYITKVFPRVNSQLARETVADYSLIYTWKGTDDRVKPVLLLAHLDVVPADAKDGWEQPPFDGRISNGFVWGRGAVDDKASVFGILESVEALLVQGFQPKRTIYLAFGHDEETGGRYGAARIAALLRSRNVEFEFILDEGLFIAENFVPGVSQPVALIGVAEKGYLSVQLEVESEGGHSSVPPTHTAIGILSAAVNRLEDHPMPASLQGAVGQMFDFVGPEMRWDKRLVFANIWLFKPLVIRELSRSPTTNASIRTTTAVTIIEAGIKDNVLPHRAKAVINFRILPGDSVESVLAHVKATVNDSRVNIVKYGDEANEPSKVSSVDALGFQILQRTVRQVFPSVLVAPALLVGATDSKHYHDLSKNVYRFVPQLYRPEDVSRLHGRNERISSENYSNCVRFYYQLIRNSDDYQSIQ